MQTVLVIDEKYTRGSESYK